MQAGAESIKSIKILSNLSSFWLPENNTQFLADAIFFFEYNKAVVTPSVSLPGIE